MDLIPCYAGVEDLMPAVKCSALIVPGKSAGRDNKGDDALFLVISFRTGELL